MARAQPVLGYPSKTAAALALATQGLTPEQIGEKIDSSASSVAGLLSGKKKPSGEPDRTEGWTLAKKEKAVRLYARIVEMVAAELNVPPVELLTLWSKGTTPPIGAARKSEIKAKPAEGHPASADPGQSSSKALGPVSLVPAAKQPDLVQPRPQSTPVMVDPVRSAANASAEWYRLKHRSGKFLHMSGEGFTEEPAHAWIGKAHQARNMKRASGEHRLLRLVPVPKWKPRDGLLARELRE